MKLILRFSYALALLASLRVVAADDPASIAFFEQKIRPALVEHCYECHSAKAKKLKGGLYLDSKAGWQKGGDAGKPIIVPGKPDEGLFLRYIRHLEPDMEMPPKKPKLADAIIADFATWIKAGAVDPRDQTTAEVKRADKSWWSLQPLSKDFKHTDIDGFIDAKLAEQKLTRSAPAKPQALIRRLSYDLTGLPPSQAEVDAFVADHEANARKATEALVDRLLASPRYGERWGRHWLDVVRFGESNGGERNFVIDDLYPFRDYVIRSLNEDKPLDQLIREHLAGDVIGKNQPAVEVGSAFLVAGPYDDVGNQDKLAKKVIRSATLDDMVTATGSAFLGLTINCARCHNHKFDPIPTEDYYRVRAAFEGVVHGRRPVATKEQAQAYNAAMGPLNKERTRLVAEQSALTTAIETKAKALLATRKYPRPKADTLLTEEQIAPTEARFVKLTMSATSANPLSGVGGRISEFEIWTDEATPRNVALASTGSKAEGVKGANAEDFPMAYSAALTIDGDEGAQWYIGTPAELVITLSRVEKISRLGYRSAKGRILRDNSQGATPTEYEMFVSLDGKEWKKVADSYDREAWSPAHAFERVRKQVTTPDEAKRLGLLGRDLAAVDKRIAAVPKMPSAWVGTHQPKPEPTFVHKGGDPTKPAGQVVPSSLAVLDLVTKPYALKADADEGERRVALANWITQDNPITARVLANRLWHYHFGTGLVDTPSDFGFMGSKPTHPELLDFLAQRLIKSDWKLKALHREIVLSQTYLQSADFNEPAARVDKDSRLLWRFPPRRLGAEEIRDTLLATAGQLKLEPMGGPGFRLYRYLVNNVSTYIPLDTQGPETYRRAVYHQNARASVVDVLNDFDLPDIAFAAPKRANTTSPLQALTLFNNSFTLDMAKALAVRLDGADPIAQAYSFALQRQPTSTERAAAEKLIAQHGKPAFCRALLNSNALIFVE
jgi:mono/diheme cytochrome c family protein